MKVFIEIDKKQRLYHMESLPRKDEVIYIDGKGYRVVNVIWEVHKQARKDMIDKLAPVVKLE